MSRTHKGKKPIGYDYWSRRTHKSSNPGKDAKRYANRAERRKGKEESKSEQETKKEAS